MKPYPKVMHYLPFVLVVVLLLLRIIADFRILALLLLLTGAICSIVSFVCQLRYFKRQGRSKQMRSELFLVIAAAVAPALALIVGDTQGGLQFGAEASSSSIDLAPFVLFAGGMLCLTVLAIVNVFIITLQMTDRTRRVLGIIGQAVTYGAIGLASYYIYAVAYSLRDPSTE